LYYDAAFSLIIVCLYGEEFSMQEQQLREFESLPQSSSCRLIDFDKAQVVPGFFPKTFFLIVTGTKPWVAMDVELRPRIYIKRPDYWEIEVDGCQSGIGLPMEMPYYVALDIPQSLGTKGIEVVGATRREQINVP
jgi:hypothetical protein